MKKTMQQKFIEALVRRGCVEIPNRSSIYKVFTRQEGGFYYVGRAGALRVGKTIAGSFPVSEKFKKIILGPDTAEQLAGQGED